MPRCPAKDYADRCTVIELKRDMLTHRAIAQTLHRPERWVRRTLARYDERAGLASLKDHPSRPHASPHQMPADIEQAICEMKQAHPGWGRRQMSRQLRWRWRDDPVRRAKISDAGVRCVLKRHPELMPLAATPTQPAPRQIEYLTCNLIWATDGHQTRLADGSTWETLQWIDLHSRYALGQVTASALTEDLVMQSFLDVARRYGLPYLIKTDRGSLFYEPTSGLPTLFERVMAALGVVHIPVGPRQPWWNGVVERRIQTCQQEVHLPSQGDAEAMNQAMEAERHFYDNERCHSRCDDQPPVTKYEASQRALPADFVLEQVPLTVQPTVITRKVQASGRLSLAGRTYYFSRRHAGQAVTVTVDGWRSTAQAADGWQQSWDLQATAETARQIEAPPPVTTPPPLTRRVDRRGCVHINHRLYYVGVAWIKQTLTLLPQGTTWTVTLPDGSTKSLPNPQLLPVPEQKASPKRSHTPPAQQPDGAVFQTRRITKTGQVFFHNRLYYAGIALHGQTDKVTPLVDGLAVYNADNAWITTCLWSSTATPDEPPCPT